MFNEYEDSYVESDSPCTAKRETDKALLVEFDDGEDRWVPKSQIHDDSEVYAADTEGTLIVKRWWAQKEGLL